MIGYYSLASGFLSGKYRPGATASGSPRAAMAAGYLDARGLRILAALDAVAAAQHTNLTRIALAWLQARPGVTAPIVSATTLAQLHDLIASTEVTLSAQQIAQLGTASAMP